MPFRHAKLTKTLQSIQLLEQPPGKAALGHGHMHDLVAPDRSTQLASAERRQHRHIARHRLEPASPFGRTILGRENQRRLPASQPVGTLIEAGDKLTRPPRQADQVEATLRQHLGHLAHERGISVHPPMGCFRKPATRDGSRELLAIGADPKPSAGQAGGKVGHQRTVGRQHEPDHMAGVRRRTRSDAAPHTAAAGRLRLG
jgi:hypothetical protein